MLPILQFIFSDFWHFAGTVILLGMVIQGIVAAAVGVAAVLRGRAVSVE